MPKLNQTGFFEPPTHHCTSKAGRRTGPGACRRASRRTTDSGASALSSEGTEGGWKGERRREGETGHVWGE